MVGTETANKSCSERRFIMSNSIRLSPKHGLNPSISVCFFCGEDKNEIILPGKLKGDAEAPRRAVYNYEPCEKCKENMAVGITLVGVVTEQPEDNRPEISKGLYPTGRWYVITEDCTRQLLQADSNLLENVLKNRKCLIDDHVLRDMIEKAI